MSESEAAIAAALARLQNTHDAFVKAINSLNLAQQETTWTRCTGNALDRADEALLWAQRGAQLRLAVGVREAE